MTAYAPTDVRLQPMESALHLDLLHASVEFGVLQANGNCVNIGICRINTTHYSNMAVTRHRNRQCPFAEALLSVSPNGRLEVFFPRAGMKACTERAFFRAPVFPVPVAYFLPESIKNELPGLQNAIISTGLYPIRQSAEGYSVVF